jgi:hypothetical protein
MLLKVFFEKAVFVKFKTSKNKTLMKHIKTTNIPLENPYLPMYFKDRKKNSRTKSLETFGQMFVFVILCDFHLWRPACEVVGNSEIR